MCVGWWWCMCVGGWLVSCVTLLELKAYDNVVRYVVYALWVKLLRAGGCGVAGGGGSAHAVALL